MQRLHTSRVDSGSLNEFARIMKVQERAHTASPTEAGRVDLNQQNVKNGIGQLVLTLVKLLHELLERQAIRRMEAGSLTDSEIERLGMTLMLQAQEIERLRKEFGLDEEDLNLDLGPLGKLL